MTESLRISIARNGNRVSLPLLSVQRTAAVQPINSVGVQRLAGRATVHMRRVAHDGMGMDCANPGRNRVGLETGKGGAEA